MKERLKITEVTCIKGKMFGVVQYSLHRDLYVKQNYEWVKVETFEQIKELLQK